MYEQMRSNNYYYGAFKKKNKQSEKVLYKIQSQ